MSEVQVNRIGKKDMVWAVLLTAVMTVVVCFVLFFVNDMYGFVSWRRMAKRQSV